ncbi:MAG: hypothetical protein ACOVQC_07960 [Flavobacterium sp.]
MNHRVTQIAILFLLLITELSYSQDNDYIPIVDGGLVQNEVYLFKSKMGWTFTNHKGNQYPNFFKEIFSIKNGVVTYCNKRTIGKGDYFPCQDEGTIHVFQIMKEMGIIDKHYLQDMSSFEEQEFEIMQIGEFGYATKNGKYAKVSRYGSILTEFKYDNENLNSYTELTKKKRHIMVVIDAFSGQEIFQTKDSLVTYWNPNNYLVKNIKTKTYYLTYNSKTYKVSENFSRLNGLPIDSNVFTYKSNDQKFNYGFATLDGGKIKSSLIPLTNFYKGHCIALEKIKEPDSKNYYGETINGKVITTFILIDEKLKTIKILTNFKYLDGNYFNKYGNIIVDNNTCRFVIDYNGAIVIPPVKFDNRMKEVYEGLYDVQDYSYTKTKESEEIINYYNQKGEKVVDPNWGYAPKYLDFKVGKNANYIMYGKHQLITLDKENRIISKNF